MALPGGTKIHEQGGSGSPSAYPTLVGGLLPQWQQIKGSASVCFSKNDAYVSSFKGGMRKISDSLVQALWTKNAQRFGPSAPIGQLTHIPECCGSEKLAPSSPMYAYSPAVEPESPLAKLLIGGGVTVMFEMVGGGHFIEFLKIAKQTSPNESYLQITKRVTGQKGIAGTLDGFFPWGFIQAIFKGTVFGWGQAAAEKLLHGNRFLSKETSNVLSGGCGGFVQGVVMSPLLLLKTRVMTDPSYRATGGLLQTAKASAAVGIKVIKQEGLLALMKGMPVFAGKRFADWTTRYFFVVTVEQFLKTSPEEKLKGWRQIFASLAGGTMSALVTIPLDVLVATFQQAANANKSVGVIQVIREEIKKGGLQGTFDFATRGLLARVAHVALTTLMMKTMTSKIYDLLYR
eukprot:gb/GECG01002899.1/.p1 GENE.gb/GECG01002899.1/~~gb/GECG01002899.1/.p1  ORF type:complete len:402 (+),score=43.92 gb/GECG01002899.1/:1-1206(+)